MEVLSGTDARIPRTASVPAQHRDGPANPSVPSDRASSDHLCRMFHHLQGFLSFVPDLLQDALECLCEIGRQSYASGFRSSSFVPRKFQKTALVLEVRQVVAHAPELPLPPCLAHGAAHSGTDNHHVPPPIFPDQREIRPLVRPSTHVFMQAMPRMVSKRPFIVKHTCFTTHATLENGSRTNRRILTAVLLNQLNGSPRGQTGRRNKGAGSYIP